MALILQKLSVSKTTLYEIQCSAVSVDLRVFRIIAIYWHLHRLEGQIAEAWRAICPPNDGDAARWR